MFTSNNKQKKQNRGNDVDISDADDDNKINTGTYEQHDVLVLFKYHTIAKIVMIMP
jgi:hypothetical protein